MFKKIDQLHIQTAGLANRIEHRGLDLHGLIPGMFPAHCRIQGENQAAIAAGLATQPAGLFEKMGHITRRRLSSVRLFFVRF